MRRCRPTMPDRLLQIFAEGLDLPLERLGDATSPETTSEWDSLAAMNLVAALSRRRSGSSCRPRKSCGCVASASSEGLAHQGRRRCLKAARPPTKAEARTRDSRYQEMLRSAKSFPTTGWASPPASTVEALGPFLPYGLLGLGCGRSPRPLRPALQACLTPHEIPRPRSCTRSCSCGGSRSSCRPSRGLPRGQEGPGACRDDSGGRSSARPSRRCGQASAADAREPPVSPVP